MTGLWIRWTLRDAAGRRLQLLATALVLALGVGAFFGLGTIRSWRESSAAASFRAAAYHDLRVTLAEGATVDAGRLRAVVRALPDPGVVAAAQERLVVPTQVDASHGGRTVLVPGQLVGIDLAGPPVDRIAAERGRGLRRDDAGRRVGVLERNFAAYYDLPATGRVTLPGIGKLDYVGQGLHPQSYVVVDQGVSGAQDRLAHVYVPLRVAQEAAGRPGAINELALKLRPGAEVALVQRALAAALARQLPQAGAHVVRGRDEDAYRILFRDAANDQRLYRLFALLILAAAAFATFNLVTRAVEAQRREIGVAMALGVSPARLAIRPLAMALQIGVLGALLGVAVGIGASEALRGALSQAYPLPSYSGAIDWGAYAPGVLVALALPLLAAAAPVARVVRGAPIDAIRTGTFATTSATRWGWVRHVRIPGGSLRQLPLRRLARSSRRTAMTVLALGGVLTAVVAIVGMVDAFQGAADRTAGELLRTSPARVVATLDEPRPRTDPIVRRLLRTPGVRAAEPGLTVGATVRSADRGLDVGLSFADMRSDVWRPAMEDGALPPDSRGIALARSAADDLDVGIGDRVVVRHPARRGDGLALVDTPVRVAAIHASPSRVLAFMTAAAAQPMGLGGLASEVVAVPARGSSPAALQRALFGRPGVASAEPVAARADTLQAGVDTFVGAIRITVVLTLALALLIAYGAATIATEERRREHATMFAFGVPVRTVLAAAVGEGLIVGALATAVGIAGGLALLSWTVDGLLGETFPDLGATVVVSARALLSAVVLGAGAVALAPLAMRRRLRRMDLPSTLRVME